MIKFRLTHKNCLPFLYEMIEDYGEAATYYGLQMDQPGEELAADTYEAAWKKLQNAVRLLESQVKVDV